MNKRNRTSNKALRDAIAKTVGARVAHVLGIMRVQGWKFPNSCDVGVSILEDGRRTARVAMRIDDVSTHATLATSTLGGGDVDEAVDNVVALWLKKHATVRPGTRQRQVLVPA